MTTDLSTGKVPAFYREVFDMCSTNDDNIKNDVFKDLLSACDLQTQTLKAIWDLTAPKQGVLSRTALYKALALIGWAEEGKVPSEKLFENFTGKEYPTPSIINTNYLKNIKAQLKLQSNPALLGLSYAEIKLLDNISIELVPEKKGLIIKYSEYTVSSRRFATTVTRRYNDFVAFYDLLLARFPYRLIPRLPPKKIVSDAHFLEERRRGLQRWLTLICRHPTVCHDALVSYFLTEQGPDVQHKIRDIFRRAPDEFMTSDLAANAKSLLPKDCSEFATNREQVRVLVQVISRLKQLTDVEVERKQAYARDAEDLANQLRTLSSVNVTQTCSGHWKHMQRGLIAVADGISPLTNRTNYYASKEQVTVCERLGLLLDILIAHRDLCERLERGLAHDHQAALAKMLSLKKRKIQGVMHGTDTESVEKLEAKMLTQENIIINMELRSDFSLYSVHMETQLVLAYLETLSTTFTSLVDVEFRTYSELADVWKQVGPIVQKFLSMDTNKTNGYS